MFLASSLDNSLFISFADFVVFFFYCVVEIFKLFSLFFVSVNFDDNVLCNVVVVVFLCLSLLIRARARISLFFTSSTRARLFFRVFVVVLVIFVCLYIFCSVLKFFFLLFVKFFFINFVVVDDSSRIESVVVLYSRRDRYSYVVAFSFVFKFMLFVFECVELLFVGVNVLFVFMFCCMFVLFVFLLLFSFSFSSAFRREFCKFFCVYFNLYFVIVVCDFVFIMCVVDILLLNVLLIV